VPPATPSDLIAEYDAICARTRAQSRVYFIGEHHDSVASRRLVSRALDTVDPTLIAVESSPSQHSLCGGETPNISEGIDESVRYARENTVPIGLIDQSQMDLMLDFSSGLPEPIPFDPPQPNNTGDIPADAIADYRERVKTHCPQRYDMLLSKREQYMARYLATLATISDGPLVTVLGASHQRAVADILTDDSLRPLDVSDKRLYHPSHDPQTE